MKDEQEQSQQWSRMLKTMGLLGGAGAVALFLGILGPVIMNQAPPLFLLLVIAPALVWMTTWMLEGRPPKGWSARDPARAEQADQRLRKVGGRLMAVGLVFAVASLVFSVLEISTHH